MSCTITFNNRIYTEAQFKNFFTHNPILVTKLREVQKSALARHKKDNVSLPDTLSIVSGGANGADKAWVDLAYAHGLYVGNSEEITMEDYYNLSQEQKDVIEKEYRFIAEKIGREITPPTGGGILVRRDMMQVQAGKTTATIAVGNLKEVKTSEGSIHRVDGGTAYATMKSVQLGIPTYFFNQATNKWVELGPNGIKRVLTSSTEIPLLDGSVTLIGTRGLSEAGFDAMNKLLGENMRTPVKKPSKKLINSTEEIEDNSKLSPEEKEYHKLILETKDYFETHGVLKEHILKGFIEGNRFIDTVHTQSGALTEQDVKDFRDEFEAMKILNEMMKFTMKEQPHIISDVHKGVDFRLKNFESKRLLNFFSAAVQLRDLKLPDSVVKHHNETKEYPLYEHDAFFKDEQLSLTQKMILSAEDEEITKKELEVLDEIIDYIGDNPGNTLEKTLVELGYAEYLDQNQLTFFDVADGKGSLIESLDVAEENKPTIKSEVMPEITFQTVDEIISKPTYQGLKLTVQGLNVEKVIPARLVKKEEIIINVEALREKYKEGAWVNPREQRDGSKAKPLPANSFNSFDEFVNFVMLHEYSHSFIFKKDGESIGDYETRINDNALAMLDKMKETQKSKEDFKDDTLGLSAEQAYEVLSKRLRKYLEENSAIPKEAIDIFFRFNSYKYKESDSDSVMNREDIELFKEEARFMLMLDKMLKQSRAPQPSVIANVKEGLDLKLKNLENEDLKNFISTYLQIQNVKFPKDVVDNYNKLEYTPIDEYIDYDSYDEVSFNYKIFMSFYGHIPNEHLEIFSEINDAVLENGPNKIEDVLVKLGYAEFVDSATNNTKNRKAELIKEMDADLTPALSDNSKLKTEIKPETKPTNEFKVKIDQYIYTLNTTTGEVTHNAVKGDKNEINATQVGKVYAAYAKEINTPTIVFNGHTYAYVLGGAVNINTGSFVQQKEILDKLAEANLPQKSTQKAKSKKDGPFIMNNDQALARKEILDFLKDDKRQTHTLSGYAGTGKTTILNEILKSYKGDVIMSAPTNKAVAVMKTKSTGTIKTIHSLLGIRADLLIEDYDVNNPAFSQNEDDSTLNNIEDVLLIIDESSMLNDSLLETIQNDFLRKGSGNKILFVGDSAQLSPVGQTHPSRALTSSEAMSQLTIVERADNNAVLKESMYIRETGDFTYTSDMDAEGNGVVFTADETNFLETIKSIFAERLESNPMVLRVVAATNREVDAVNNYMYNYFYPNSELNLNPGQIMMGNINWNSDAKGDKLIENSGDFKIISSRPGTKNLAGVEVAGEFIEVQNLNSKTTFKSFAVGENPIEVLHTIAEYSEHLKRLAQADKKKWGAYYLFQNSFIATSNITTNTGRTIFKPALVPGYAHTIHKSQGGTYENIAVMTQGLDQVQNWDAKDKAQLRYVAATRAEKGVYVLSSINKMNAPTENTREIKGIEQIITEGFFLGERVMRQPQGIPNTTARFDMGYNFFIVNPQELNRLYQDKLWAQPFTAGDGSVVEPIPVTAFRNIDDFTSFMMAKKYFEAYNIRDESKENMAQWQARSYSYAFKTLELNFGYKAETKIPTPKEESIEPVDVVTPVNPSNIEIPSAPIEGTITDSSNPFAGFSQSSGGFGSGRNIFQELQEKANATSTEESTITDYEQREFPNVKNC